jgi:hypothetical protein
MASEEPPVGAPYRDRRQIARAAKAKLHPFGVIEVRTLALCSSSFNSLASDPHLDLEADQRMRNRSHGLRCDKVEAHAAAPNRRGKAMRALRSILLFRLLRPRLRMGRSIMRCMKSAIVSLHSHPCYSRKP